MLTSSKIDQKRIQPASGVLKLGLVLGLSVSIVVVYGIYSRFEGRAWVKVGKLFEAGFQGKPSPLQRPEAPPASTKTEDKAESL